MDKLNDYTLIDALHDLMVEIRSMNSRLNEIEKKLSSLITETKTPDNRNVFNSTAAAEYLGVAKPTLYSYVSSGKIPFSKPTGKRIFFQKEKLDEWLLQNPHKSNYEIEMDASNYILRSGRRKL
jgi:excisionase family DNA binding protein